MDWRSICTNGIWFDWQVPRYNLKIFLFSNLNWFKKKSLSKTVICYLVERSDSKVPARQPKVIVRNWYLVLFLKFPATTHFNNKRTAYYSRIVMYTTISLVLTMYCWNVLITMISIRQSIWNLLTFLPVNLQPQMKTAPVHPNLFIQLLFLK